jgi:hypothetical protein
MVAGRKDAQARQFHSNGGFVFRPPSTLVTACIQCLNASPEIERRNLLMVGLGKMKFAVTLASVSLVVTACGGGGSSSTTTTSTTDSVTSNATATSSAIGASDVSVASADTALLAGADRAVDLTADVGDSWRLVFNQSTGNFAIRVLQTSFGLVNQTGTFTKSTSGSFETFSGSGSNSSFTLTYDKRTNTVVGVVTVQTKQSRVSGTGKTISDVAKLAGDYVYIGATTNISGTNRTTESGTVRIATDGTVKVCTSGQVNAGGTGCDNIGATVAATMTTFALTKDTTTGLLKLTPTAGVTANAGFVIVHVQTGDRGPVLGFDIDWTATGGTRRVGAFVAAKPQTIDNSYANGTYSCRSLGGGQYTTTASNGSFSSSSGAAGTVELNKVATGANGATKANFPGVFNYTYSTPNAVAGQSFNGFPVSTTLLLMQDVAAGVNYCIRQ